MGYVGHLIEPVHKHNALVLFFDYYLGFALNEVEAKVALCSKKCKNIALVVIGEVTDGLYFAKVDDLEVLFVDYVDQIFIVEKGDVLMGIVKVLGELT